MFWIGISQISLLLSNFMLLKLLASQLSVYEYGQYALVMSVVLFVRQIFYDPFSIVAAKESAAEPEKLSDIIYVAKIITNRIAAGLLLSGFLLVIFFCSASEIRFMSVPFVCGLIYVCANGAQGFYVNIFNSVKERKPASIISMIDSFGRILVVSLVFLLIERSLIHTLVSISVSAVVSIVIFRFYINSKFIFQEKSLEKSNELIKKTVSMSLPFILPTVLLGLKGIGDRWMLASYLGVSDLAGYSVLLQIGYSPMILFFGMAQTYVAPKIYGFGSVTRSENLRKLKSFINRMLFLIMFIAFLACATLTLISDWIFNFLAGKNYQDLVPYLPYFVIAGALSAAAGILQLAVIGVFKSKDASLLLALTLLCGAICTALLIFGLGFNGAVAGLVASALMTLIVYWFKLNQVLKSKIQEIS